MFRRCDFWTKRGVSNDDIDVYRFDWWCYACEMAIKDCDVVDGKCPQCGDEVTDMENIIDVWEEYESSPGNGLSYDEEGNVGYD